GEVGDAADGLADAQLAAGEGDEPGTVVAAVFQAAQAFEQDWRRLAPPGVTDDAAHWGGPRGPWGVVPSNYRSRFSAPDRKECSNGRGWSGNRSVKVL